MMTRRAAAYLFGLAILPLVFGCDLLRQSPPTSITAWITPTDGRVPYTATIFCDALPGEFTFELPNETVGPQPTNTLEVTVDSLEWGAVVTWTDGITTLASTVRATGNNSRPLIRGIRINGLNDLWQLEPMDRTLIETIVDYADEWRVTSISVEGSGCSAPFTVFYPPYEPGVCHASWKGWIIENAGIVYPVYASIDTDGLPYAPNGLEDGYPTSYRMTNKLIYDYGSVSDTVLEIPAQDGFVTVTVEDNFGRLTARTIAIPIQACDYRHMPQPQPQPSESTRVSKAVTARPFLVPPSVRRSYLQALSTFAAFSDPN